MNKWTKSMLKIVRDKGILFVVFITGACVLVIEVVATRILSPYFGNTIFSVSSVIGVVLASLSFGYYFGGNLADKKPDEKIFYSIIILSGLSTLLIKVFILFVLPTMGYTLPITYGPLVSSIILFCMPSFLMGTLSPYAIKLYSKKMPKMGVGKLTGEIFFSSTFGSIFGSFLTGFYLIPKFGIDKIIIGVGVTLFLIGALGLLNVKKNGNALIKSLFLFIFLFFAASLNIPARPQVVYSKDALYEKVSVVDTKFKDEDVRLLLQDRSYSSAIYLDKKKRDELVFGYTKYYKLYKFFNESPKKALFMGGGAYTLPSLFVNKVDGVQVDVTEIEPELYNISREYFGIKENPRLANHIEDGRRFLHDTTNSYDIIFSDVYASIYSIPTQFTTKEFFELAKSKLGKDGIMFVNVISDLSRRDASLIFSEIKTFREVFPVSYYFAVDSPDDLNDQNIIFLGVNGDKKLNFDAGYSKEDKDFLNDIKVKNLDLNRFNLSNQTILTDNYAPTEMLTAGLLKRINENKYNFNGEESLSIIRQLLSYGTRSINTEGHDRALTFISAESKAVSGGVTVDKWEEEVGSEKYKMSNVYASLSPENKKRIILATHYDSLPDNPGANNSASGVAVLLHLMSVIKNVKQAPGVGVDFIFFDGEEGVRGAKWKAYGSEHFAANINKIYPKEKPFSAIVLDMVCDKNLNIYKEGNSAEKAGNETALFFAVAGVDYPKNFLPKVKYTIDDDHSALNKIGIPSTLLIDFDYPYYNSQKDTPDKCSAVSLSNVGNSLLKYIYSL